MFKNKKNKGFSLLELILAIAIFSITSVALTTLLIDTNLSTKLSLDRTEALFFAREGIEAVRSIRDNNWSSLVDGTYGLDLTSGAWTFTSSPDIINNKYTRSVNIATVSTSTISTTVIIEWALVSDEVVNVTLNTVYTNWK